MRHLISKSLIITMIIFSVGSYAQTRLICHIATDTANFNNTLYVANLSDENKIYSLFAYSDAGILLGTLQNQSIDGKATFKRELSELFSSLPSYIKVEGDNQITVSVGYSSTATNGTTAFVHDTSESVLACRLYPGNWETVFDGLVFLNMGVTSSSVTMNQKDTSGSILNSITRVVEPGVKGKMVLGSGFSTIDSSFFEIESSEPIFVMALSGSLPGASPSYLWMNPLIPFTPSVSAETESAFNIVDLWRLFKVRMQITMVINHST